MTQGKVRFFAEQRDFGDKVAIYIREDGPSEGRDSVALIVFQKVEEGFRSDPALTVRTSEAQELMDALWSAGLRPAEGAGSAGAMAATERHLADMRAMAMGALRKAGAIE